MVTVDNIYAYLNTAYRMFKINNNQHPRIMLVSEELYQTYEDSLFKVYRVNPNVPQAENERFLWFRNMKVKPMYSLIGDDYTIG